MYNVDWQHEYYFREPEGFDCEAEQFYSDKMDEKETEILHRLAKLIRQDCTKATSILKVLSHCLEELDLPEANKIAIALDFDKLDFVTISGDFEQFKKVYHKLNSEGDF